MIEKEKNEQGFIYAYLEWLLVNDEGQISKNGEFCWVNDLWIHKDYRRNGVLRSLINKLCEHAPPTARYGYWTREKYNGRKSICRKFNIYTRRKLWNGLKDSKKNGDSIQ